MRNKKKYCQNFKTLEFRGQGGYSYISKNICSLPYGKIEQNCYQFHVSLILFLYHLMVYNDNYNDKCSEPRHEFEKNIFHFPHLFLHCQHYLQFIIGFSFFFLHCHHDMLFIIGLVLFSFEFTYKYLNFFIECFGWIFIVCLVYLYQTQTNTNIIKVYYNLVNYQ